jgi:hypothetical protein
MTTQQRRRGQPATLYRTKDIVDSRGNKVRMVDLEDPYEVMAWTFPQRSSVASLPGQQDIDVVRFGTTSDLDRFDSWSQLDYKGHRYDVVSPPAYHHGTRHTRHWSIDARKRPHG